MGRARAKARRLAAVAAVAGAVLPAAGSAHAAAPPTPWDGTNPFVCMIQNVGTGTDFPSPGADPFCVEFDKTHQNVNQLGVVDFLSQEPARVAAASDKCWYFQHDHWVGYVVQGDPTSQTYKWDGSYFFDKSTGDGGAYVTNMSFNGKTFDPTTLPGFPAQYGPYFGPGTGGFISHNSVQTDPRCIAQATSNPHSVYGATSARSHGCLAARGSVGSRRLGYVTLGMKERQVRDAIGDPPAVKRGFLRYCLLDGTSFLVGEPGDRSGELGSGSGEPVVIVLSTSRAFGLQGVHVGTLERKLRRGWTRATLRMKMGRTRVYALNRRSGVLCGVRGGVVRWLAVYDRGSITKQSSLTDYLRRGTG